MSEYDAVVIGSGPNGLAAAIVLAQAGRRVVVLEAEQTLGGGARSAELTLPGFVHDLCSAVHPFGPASPFFRTLPLDRFGLKWLEPAIMLAHPFDDGQCTVIRRGVEETAKEMGRDRAAYLRVIGGIVARWPQLEDAVLGPLRWPNHPLAAARFGLRAVGSAEQLATWQFAEESTRALFAGIAAHAMLPLDRRPTAAFGLVLNALAHVAGWVIPEGGAQRISNALAAYLQSLGGEVVTGSRVESIERLPLSRVVLCDLSPQPLLRIAGHKFPASYRRKLERYRYGMAAFKVDWALDGPIPWRSEACRQAGTVHVGGSFDEISRSEAEAWEGRVSDRPFVLVSQPTVVDASRAPTGGHVVWTYCHVPHASTADVLPHIERQIERFAPGFRKRVRSYSVMRPADIEHHNANFVGGDIASGVVDLWQLFTRPSWREYSTPVRGLYLCSASTPPGVGVHGMCGFHAAKRALHEVLID